MPAASGIPITCLSASPHSTRFEETNPTYITMTMPITSSEPSEPN